MPGTHGVGPPLPRPRPDLVVFDCDGVLVDSERLAVEVDRQILAELGWELSVDQVVERFVGLDQERFVAEIEAYLGRPLPPDWDAPYVPRYRAAFAEHLVAVPGVGAVLDALAAAGVGVCVASNGTAEGVRRRLALTQLTDRFADERVFSVSDVAVGKPAPDLFLLAADRCGVAPDRCVVVEDSPTGVAAARAAGMPVVAFAGGLVPPRRLAGATALAASMEEVRALLLG